MIKMQHLNFSRTLFVRNNFFNTRYTSLCRYCIYRNQKKSSFRVCKLRRSFSSDLSSVKANGESCLKQLSEDFPEPRSILQRLVNEAFLKSQSSDVKPEITIRQFTTETGSRSMWQATILMNWPEKFTVEGIAARKSEAEKLAYLHACQKMKEYGSLSDDNMPVIPENVLTFGDMEIRNAKSELSNVFQIIWSKFGNKDLIPKYQSSKMPGLFEGTYVWNCELALKYPEHMTFAASAHRLVDAEKIAAAKALYWLYETGVINKKKSPILYSSDDEKKMLANHNMPSPIYIPENTREAMKSILDAYTNLKNTNSEIFMAATAGLDKSNSSNLLADQSYNVSNCDIIETATLRDVLTEMPYRKLSEDESAKRNQELFEKHTSLYQSSSLADIVNRRFGLPIANRKEEILKLVDKNQVVVLSGETGCGKTTQVPQYIIDHFISQMKGSECNIVVTQPRRICAISIAECVANERGEKVGDTIGHQVRLDKSLPHGNGSILYCSTGILLRKLYFNPNLQGVSHVIVDEVHERHVHIDFLLILLKRLIQTNSQIKVILMSATFNTFMFSHYFNNCPVIHIPGFLYPVQEYFLDDIKPKLACKNIPSESVRFDAGLIAEVINYIDSTQPAGAILCFLPGWHEINEVLKELSQILQDKKKYMLCILHSKILPSEQRRAFINPEKGIRKIILATNVAETSITINDVVYVVNSGFEKSTSFDPDKGVPSLGTQWITKSSVRQRRGRAGRVQPGVCYHVFPRKMFMDMEDYPTPEMLRIPLEKSILDCKLCFPEEKAEDILALALQPPSRVAIQHGIQELVDIGILNQDENLTDLGKCIKFFATHPRLSKALAVATFLRCLDPVLSISALLTISGDAFSGILDNKSEVRQIKQDYDASNFSDHLALYKVFCTWDSIKDEVAQEEFVKNNLLDSDSLKFAKQLKGLFTENLYESKFIKNLDDAMDPCSKYNENSQNDDVVLAALSSAFYPNVIKLIQGEVSHGRLNKDAIIYSTLKGQKTAIQRESVASKVYHLPSPYLIYYSAMKCETRKLLMTPAVSSVPGSCLLFFAGRELQLKQSESSHETENAVVLVIDNHSKLSFSCQTEDAILLINFRKLLDENFQAYLLQSNKFYNYSRCTEFFNLKVQPVLIDLLQIPQIPFSPGRTYKFVNGKLHASYL